MQIQTIPVNEKIVAFNQDVEKALNLGLRTMDRLKERVGLPGRKGRYDDAHYEFEGGAQEALRMKHYDKSLRLLWKAEEHADWSTFRDCTKDELMLLQMAEKNMSAEERKARKRLHSQNYREMLKKTYTPEQRQAIVNVLSLIGHGEAYAWLVSAELLNEVKSTGGRAALTMQVMEEAKHFVVLRELLQAFDVPIPRMNGWEYLWLEWVFKARGTEKFFGMNVQVESVALTLKESAATRSAMETVATIVEKGLFKREYRDHRLEWMIKSGGIDVVLTGLAKDNIRFSNDFQ